MLRSLFKRSSSFRTQKQEEKDPNHELRRAARVGNLKIAKASSGKSDQINAQSRHGYTAAHHAINNNRLEMMIWLKGQGADFSIAPTSLLHRILWQNQTPQQKLNDKLRKAAKRGDYKRVDLLLQAGADPNASKNGFTAWDYAICNGHGEVGALLCRYGATPPKSVFEKIADAHSWPPPYVEDENTPPPYILYTATAIQPQNRAAPPNTVTLFDRGTLSLASLQRPNVYNSVYSWRSPSIARADKDENIPPPSYEIAIAS